MRALVAFTLLALPLTGCLSGSTPGTTLPGPGGPSSPFSADCAIATAPWPDPCTAHASPNPSRSKTEIDLAVNPTDPLNVVVASKDLDAEASSCVWSVAQVTKDGGKTWSTTYVGGKTSERSPGDPLHGWGCITDPILAFGADGTLYYALQAYNWMERGSEGPAESAGVGYSQGSAFFLAISRDGGDTFPEILTLAPGDGFVAFHDYPRMATNPRTGSLHVAWTAYTGLNGLLPVYDVAENAYVVTYRDGDRAGRPPARIPSAPGEFLAFYGGLAATSDGAVHAVLIRQGPAGRTLDGPIVLATSRDDGQTFPEVRPMFEVTRINALPNVEFRAGTHVELAADVSGGPRDGWLYAVWGDARNGNADVLFSRSTDGGGSWSAPVLVNDDLGTTDQWMPRVAVGGDGTLHVLFMDRRFDPGNRLLDATYAYSTDGGGNWTNVRLTASPFDGDLGIHQNGGPFIGDYVGIGAAGTTAYAGWSDTRTGAAEIAVSRLLKR